jgi:predicted nucleotidyltransferase component of viral defense system
VSESSPSRAALESLLAKLRHRARAQGLRPDLVFHLYVHERFLARLASSPYQAHFILKGGLNLYSRLGNLARPTTDINLAGRGMPATPEALSKAVLKIMALEAGDLVQFRAETLRIDTILAEAKYGGLRLEFDALVGSARQLLQLDVSFGNTITPAPITLEFPALLEKQGYFLLGYPLETILAEKTAASVELGEANTRQKDFYDLHQLSLLTGFEASGVRTALEHTFTSRDLDLSRAISILEGVAKSPDMAQRWATYLKRNRLQSVARFPELMARVLLFLVPLLENSARGEWMPERECWLE